MVKKPLIVAVGGTLRPNSSTERIMGAVLAEAENGGAQTRLFSGEAINFPMYQPNRPISEAAVMEYIGALRRADAIILGSPGYHGSVSGLVKNAIDYTEEMANDPMPYFTDKPVGCVATGFGWQGCNATLQGLRAIVHALRGWPTPLGIALNTRTPSFDDTGACVNPELAAQIRIMAGQLLD